MIKTIMLPSGDSIKLSSSAAFLYIYNDQFNEDAIKATQSIYKDGELSSLTFYNLVWALAACADENIEEPRRFYMAHPDFKPLDHADEIIALISDCFSSEDLVKNAPTPAKVGRSKKAAQ